MAEKFFRGLGAGVAASIMFAILCYLFMRLWNACLVGAIDGINEISYMRTLGIVALFGILLIGVIVMFSLFTYNPSDQTEE